jgi:adenosyl cobinamide kinase/adenosyl cobinamide phosphate guanylyltransferase
MEMLHPITAAFSSVTLDRVSLVVKQKFCGKYMRGKKEYVSVKRVTETGMHVEVWNHRERRDNSWLTFHKSVAF